MNMKIRLAALAALVFLAGGCSQKDPAAEAIDAAEGVLEAVYEDAQKYVPERYAEVKAELETARKAFDEERYTDAIAAVKDVPAHAEELARISVEAKQKRLAELNAEWTQLSGSLPGLVAGIETRLGELGKMRKLPKGMDKQLLSEANAAFGSARGAWDKASAAFTAGDLDTAVTKARDVESMAQDLMARLGMQAG
ncbi:MAG: putative peptidoglycan binding protein [Steroidobacteraceae bacterium]|nr:putative peptidoglycan binding protein [Steroidobacteraceae bacterium]MBM2854251.1 putative peptidoglycan binding protein [Steroidobacteraceae bacterium]